MLLADLAILVAMAAMQRCGTRREMQRRREAYAERRRRWVEAWFQGARPEPPTDDEEGSRLSGRTIHDRRQFRFDF